MFALLKAMRTTTNQSPLHGKELLFCAEGSVKPKHTFACFRQALVTSLCVNLRNCFTSWLAHCACAQWCWQIYPS